MQKILLFIFSVFFQHTHVPSRRMLAQAQNILYYSALCKPHDALQLVFSVKYAGFTFSICCEMEILSFSQWCYYLCWGHAVFAWTLSDRQPEQKAVPGRRRCVFSVAPVFDLPGAVTVYFLLCFPKPFQNIIFTLIPNSRFLSTSRTFPCQVWRGGQEQLRWGHKKRGLQRQDCQCHVSAALCCSSSSDVTALDTGQNSTYLAETCKSHTFPDLMGNISSCDSQKATWMFVCRATSLYLIQKLNLCIPTTAKQHGGLPI